MSKNIFIAIALFVAFNAAAQENNGSYFKKPFSIYRSANQVVMAGEVNTFVYSNFYGRDVKNQIGSDPHKKPEFAIYEFFRNVKARNIDAVKELYDSSFSISDLNLNKAEAMLKDVTDIQFLSKFSAGDLVYVRYDFIAGQDHIPYFAVVRNMNGKYYLTLDLNLSDPFNMISSLSPYNLFDKAADVADISHMAAFYFVDKNGKIFFTTEQPTENHTTLYLAMTNYNEQSKGPELDLLKKMKSAAMSNDPMAMNKLIIRTEESLLSDPSYAEYIHEDLVKIFRNYSEIAPLGSIETGDGKIVYFKFSNAGETPTVGSILFRKWGNQWFISMRRTYGEMNNILQNSYVREALYNYFKQKI